MTREALGYHSRMPLRRPLGTLSRITLGPLAPRRPPRPGVIETLDAVPSAILGITRPVYVYLPAGYAEGTEPLPVVYMQDGQNLFDPALSFAGAWHAQHAVERDPRGATRAILVGIANHGAERLQEYSPFVDPHHGGGRAERYLAFVTEELKPLIDARYRTRPERGHTSIVGSSMGGLLALWALFRRPDVFGAAGVMSPALWFAGRAIFPLVRRWPAPGGRIHLDVGTMEGESTLLDARRMRDLLVDAGYRLGVDLQWEEEEGGRHNEAAWGRRFHRALPFLLGVGPEGARDAR